MASSQLSMFVLFASFVVLYHGVVAQIITIGCNETERNALLTFKAGFNNAFLNSNWQGFICMEWYGVQCTKDGVVGITLENLNLAGKINTDAFFNLTLLSVLSFKNNSIYGHLMDFSKNTGLTKVDFSSNLFDGPISTSLVNLDFLESLQLQENRLNGSIPPFSQDTLKNFNVSNNNLSGAIPNTRALESFDSSSYDHNKYLCGPPSFANCGPTSPTSTNNSKTSLIEIVLITVNVVGLCILVILLRLYCKKVKYLNLKNTETKSVVIAQDDGEKGRGRERESDYNEKGNLVFVDGESGFELGDLLKASAESLGKGNFGNTYKAILDDGRNVVVKRLRDLKPLSCDEFMMQLEAVAKLTHPNLLNFLAYYCSKDERFLVHKFVPNGNLFNRLHGGRGTKDRVPFRWSARLSVARAVARALEYLHMNLNSQILVPHGNLKSSNVLLDDNNLVLVSDYGLTSIVSNTIVAQRMVSFKSPEYLAAKRMSKKSDVWSYGGLLMELLTGRVSGHSAPQDSKAVDLCSWVHRAVREEWTAEIFNLEIMVQRSASHGMLSLLQIAVRCCDRSPEKRPEMSEVVREVENIKVVNVESESEEDLSIGDRSLTDDSMSGTPSR